MTVDVAVVGAGPAGSAAAIQCASAGLTTAILERESFPRDRPGETLPPGIEPLLDQLGIYNLPFPRHSGHWVEWEGPALFEKFGADDRGPWLGFQAWRADFDAHLLKRARAAGATVKQPARALRALLLDSRVIGVAASDEEVRSRFVIDAGGGGHWLARHLDLRVEPASPKLTAVYRYSAGVMPEQGPLWSADESGWTWKAQVRENLIHTTRLAFDGSVPDNAGGRRADVTWRRVECVAGPGYFLVGDAAAVLDPAASHGVLKAVMSGMMAGFLIGRHFRDGISEEAIAAEYNRWLGAWFQHDVEQLRALYRRLPHPPNWLRTTEQ